jgi:hypothetical protein
VPPIPPSDHIPPVAEPLKEPPKPGVVPPWQIGWRFAPALTIADGVTTCVFEEVATVHGFPPVDVKVKVAVPVNAAGDVQVAFNVFAFGLKEPPAELVHVPPVAEPPTEPPNGAVVPPWQIALNKEPALAVGVVFTVIFFVALAVPQEPPVVVKVKVAMPLKVTGGFHVAFSVVAPGVNVPPMPPSDQMPPVAEVIDPPKPAVVPPWQIVAAAPAFAVGAAVIVCAGDMNFVFPGPTPPPLSPNQETPSYTMSNVRLLVPPAKGVV